MVFKLGMPIAAAFLRMEYRPFLIRLSLARLSLALLVVGLTELATAEIRVCEQLVTSKPEQRAYATVYDNDRNKGYYDHRSVQMYNRTLKSDFLSRLLKAKRYFDCGGGIGQAVKEAVELNPLLEALNITMNPEMRTGTQGRVQTLSSIPVEQVLRKTYNGMFDVITDFYGALSYSPYPGLVLQRINDWLAPDGVAYLFFKNESMVQVNGAPMNFADWIIKRSGLNCRQSEGDTRIVECRKGRTKNLLVPHVELVRTTNSVPPIRTFKEVAYDDLQANIRFEVYNDAGQFAGKFEANLSPDGEYLSHVDFEILEKRAGHSYAMIDKLMQMYPKINVVRASLAVDNDRAMNEALRLTQDEYEAIKSTPFYKTFARHGLDQVSFYPFFPGGEVILRKP